YRCRAPWPVRRGAGWGTMEGQRKHPRQSATVSTGQKPRSHCMLINRLPRSSELTTEFVRHDLAKNSSSTPESDRVRVIREGVASYLPDIDPDETAEWLESFDGLLERSGPARARYLMLRLLERAGEQRVSIPALTSTDYV